MICSTDLSLPLVKRFFQLLRGILPGQGGTQPPTTKRVGYRARSAGLNTIDPVPKAIPGPGITSPCPLGRVDPRPLLGPVGKEEGSTLRVLSHPSFFFILSFILPDPYPTLFLVSHDLTHVITCPPGPTRPRT